MFVSNFEVLEDVECRNYKILNNEACSVIFTGSIFNMAPSYAYLEVISRTGSLGIEFRYGSNFDTFDKELPAVKNIIKSFKLIKWEKV
jgi:hypothetical protein